MSTNIFHELYLIYLVINPILASSLVERTLLELIIFRLFAIYLRFCNIQINPLRITLKGGNDGLCSGSFITETPKIFLIVITKNKVTILLIAKGISKFVSLRIRVFFTPWKLTSDDNFCMVCPPK